MLKRKYTNIVNWILDNLVPPVLRDSKFFMAPMMSLVLGPKYKHYMEFKDKLNTLSDDEINNYYSLLSDTFIKRETDLSDSSIDYIIHNLCGGTVLDAGCGKGYLCGRIASLGGINKVSGIDIAVESGLSPEGVDYTCGSILDMPFEDDSFDTVVCTHTLEHVRDIGRALDEIRRVAKKRLIIVMPRQREYKYTFDLHIHFAPYLYSFRKLLGSPDGEYILSDNDFIFIGEMKKSCR